jgi:hypothetical protein
MVLKLILETFQETMVTDCPFIVTALVPCSNDPKFPLSVTRVPPSVDPVFGDMPDMVGIVCTEISVSFSFPRKLNKTQ